MPCGQEGISAVAVQAPNTQQLGKPPPPHPTPPHPTPTTTTTRKPAPPAPFLSPLPTDLCQELRGSGL
jgi:hypothetical protein